MNRKRVAAIAGFAVSAVAGLMPLVLAGGRMPAPHGGTDPLAQAAQLAHAARHFPWQAEFWNPPWMHPTAWAQTFLDPMAGPSVLARAVPGVAVDYHVALWFTLATATAAMAWCARRFGLGTVGAWSAGVVYTVGPYAAGHYHHLNQVPAPWLPLALGSLLLLVRGDRSWMRAAIFVAMVALQASWSVYATAALILAAVVLVSAHGVDRMRPATVPALAVAGIGTLGVLAAAAVPYVLAARALEDFGRDPSQVLAMQARWFDAWKAPAPRLLPWPAHDPLRPSLYPGLVWSILGAIGAWRWGRELAGRTVLAIGVAGLGFAFGRSFLIPFTESEIPLPFAWLQDHLWPLGALRDPSRFALLAWWALALFGAFAAVRLWRRRRTVALAVLAVAAIDLAPGPVAGVTVDHDAAVVDALADLPADAVWALLPSPCDETEESARDARAMHWALTSGRRLAGGASGFVPADLARLRADCCDATATTCAPALRANGVDWIVIDSDLGLAGDPVWTDGTWSLWPVERLSTTGASR